MGQQQLWFALCFIMCTSMQITETLAKKRPRAQTKSSDRRHKGMAPKRKFKLPIPIKRRARRYRYKRRTKGLTLTTFERRFPPKKWRNKLNQKKRKKRQGIRRKKHKRKKK